MKLTDLTEAPTSTQTISAQVPLQYRIVETKSSDAGLILYLHGYQDNGTSFFRRLYGLSDTPPANHPLSDLRDKLDDYSHLVPHAPFPVPVRTETGWKEAYSWYFFNEQKNQILIAPDAALDGLESIMLSWAKMRHERTRSETNSPSPIARRPLYIVSFSQGGYLMAYLFKRFLGGPLRSYYDLKGAVPIATGYDPARYPAGSEWMIQGITPPLIHAIHPERDPIFQKDRIEQGLNALNHMGYATELTVIPGLDHKVSKEVGQSAMSFLSSLSGRSSSSSRNR